MSTDGKPLAQKKPLAVPPHSGIVTQALASEPQPALPPCRWLHFKDPWALCKASPGLFCPVFIWSGKDPV